MKVLVVLLFFVIILFGYILALLNPVQSSENRIVAISPTPKPDDCVEENYKHKTEAELAAMTPAQLIDEGVKEQLYHMPSFDEYGGTSIYKYIRKAGVKILPVLIEYMNDYDPKSSSRCNSMRFFVVSGESSGLDRGLVRLRGINEGQVAIAALERAIERMREAGFDKKESKYNSDFDFSLLLLKEEKGTNIRDRMIMNTLRAKHKVEMTDGELLEFTNFLISLDPTYPTWSDVGEYGPPALVKDSKRYYEAYLKFKTKR